MVSERSGRVDLSHSPHQRRISAKVDFDMHVQLRAQDVQREGQNSQRSSFFGAK